MRTVQPSFLFASQYQNNKKMPLASPINKTPHFRGRGNEKFTFTSDGILKADNHPLEWHKDGREVAGYLYEIDDKKIGFQPINIPEEIETERPKPGGTVRITQACYSRLPHLSGDKIVRVAESDNERSGARPRIKGSSGDCYSSFRDRNEEDGNLADSEEDIHETRKALRSSAGDTSLVRYRKESPSPAKPPNRIWQSAADDQFYFREHPLRLARNSDEETGYIGSDKKFHPVYAIHDPNRILPDQYRNSISNKIWEDPSGEFHYKKYALHLRRHSKELTGYVGSDKKFHEVTELHDTDNILPEIHQNPAPDKVWESRDGFKVRTNKIYFPRFPEEKPGYIGTDDEFHEVTGVHDKDGIFPKAYAAHFVDEFLNPIWAQAAGYKLTGRDLRQAKLIVEQTMRDELKKSVGKDGESSTDPSKKGDTDDWVNAAVKKVNKKLFASTLNEGQCGKVSKDIEEKIGPAAFMIGLAAAVKKGADTLGSKAVGSVMPQLPRHWRRTIRTHHGELKAEQAAEQDKAHDKIRKSIISSDSESNRGSDSESANDHRTEVRDYRKQWKRRLRGDRIETNLLQAPNSQRLIGYVVSGSESSGVEKDGGNNLRKEHRKIRSTYDHQGKPIAEGTKFPATSTQVFTTLVKSKDRKDVSDAVLDSAKGVGGAIGGTLGGAIELAENAYKAIRSRSKAPSAHRNRLKNS